MLILAPATASDIKAFYGQVSPTLQAVCVRRDGEPVLIVGLAFERRQARFFSEHKMTDRELHTVTAWRAVKQAMEFVKVSKVPVAAVAECIEGVRNLTRLGFRHVIGETYVWPG